MNAKEILLKAAELLEPEGAWIQGDFARNAAGIPVHPSGPEAVSWCANGAICHCAKCTIFEATDVAYEAMARVAEYLDEHPCTEDALEIIAEWNDHDNTTQAEVVATLRKAAESP